MSPTSTACQHIGYHVRGVFNPKMVMDCPEHLVRGWSNGRLEISFTRNAWCRFMLSDPVTYPDPDVFNPERFLGEVRQPDPRKMCFGWGRRVCSGQRLVESIIFIYIATALATLDISRCVENGVECVPKYEFKEGMIRRVCSIVLACSC